MASEKGFAHLLVLIVLLVGIVIGVYLTLHPQIFKPKAEELSSPCNTHSSTGSNPPTAFITGPTSAVLNTATAFTITINDPDCNLGTTGLIPNSDLAGEVYVATSATDRHRIFAASFNGSNYRCID